MPRTMQQLLCVSVLRRVAQSWSPPDVSSVSGSGRCGFQMYRVSADIAPQFYSSMFNLQAMVKYLNASRPGCWPYPE